MRRISTAALRRRPRRSWPSVASRRLSCATARCTAARSCAGLVGSARSSSASGRAGGSFSVRSISARSSSRRRWRSKRLICSRSSDGSSALTPPCAWRPRVRRMRCTSTPITPEPSPRAAEGGDRQPGQVAHLAVASLGDRLADRLAQLVEIEALAALVAATLADAPVERLLLGRAEEEAIEEQLEDAAVLLGLGDRGGQSLTEVVLLLPRHRFERCERVEDLRGPDRKALAAQLVAEGYDARGEARWPPVSLRPRHRAGPRQASPRRARPPGPCRCGA